jgi:hypothetical protein
MPTILRVGSYRFFFYASDLAEPPHVHVSRDESVAKFWIDPVRLARSGRFNGREVRDIDRLVRANVEFLLEAWHGYFRG